MTRDLIWMLPLLIVGFIGYCYFDGYVSGWKELSRVYRSKKTFAGKRYGAFWANTTVSTSMNGWTPFMMFGANGEGLHISVPFFLRVAHPPLFIPWTDITTITAEKVLWFKRYAFEIAKAPDVSLIISIRIGKHLAEAAGASWPPVRVSL